MRRLSVLLLILLTCSCATGYKINGPQGGLATTISLPKGFNPQTDSCDVVLLMHGIFSSKDYPPMPRIAKELAANGIASISIDFGGHGKSEGKKVDMTIEKELQEARALWEYARSMPYVRNISLLGHSQGGVIASMLGGMLAAEGDAPRSVILLAPGSVIKDACRSGHFFSNSFDPKDPPEYIKCFGLYKVGREYMLSSQNLQIYETASMFEGPVCIVHGTKDGIVPLWCSERYHESYKDSQLHLIEGENHLMVSHLDETCGIILEFLSPTVLGGQYEGSSHLFVE